MSVEEDKAVVRRWIEAFNERDKQAEAEARAPGYLAHVPGESAPLDSEAWTWFLAPFEGALPDLRIEVKDILSEGDLVAACARARLRRFCSVSNFPKFGRRVARPRSYSRV